MLNKGYATIYLIGIILLLGIGASGLIILNANKAPVLNEIKTTPRPIFASAPVSSPASVTATPKAVSPITSAAPKIPDKTAISSPTPSPTPQAKTITVTGFAYEDRTNDGLFNSDDPKLPYMQFLIYDSSNNQWINTIYSGQDGEFVINNTVLGNLIVKPTCNNNFCPKDKTREFSSSSSQQQFAFRSASAPTSNNNGVIEGDVIVDGNRAYKFYLLDKNNNYFSNGEWAGGHFKFSNLPNDQTYIIRISYGDGSPSNTEVTLTPASPEKKTLQVHAGK